MRVTKRKKKERKANPDAGEKIEVDAFADEGLVVVTFGDSEIMLEPEQALELADLIADASGEAEATAPEDDEDEEDED